MRILFFHTEGDYSTPGNIDQQKPVSCLADISPVWLLVQYLLLLIPDGPKSLRQERFLLDLLAPLENAFVPEGDSHTIGEYANC